MKDAILTRYELAGKIHQGSARNTMTKNDVVHPHWIVGSHCFWYKRASKNGNELRLVDPQSATNEPAFDHKALSDALSNATKQIIDYQNLPLKNVTITLAPLEVFFTAFDKHWGFKSETEELKEIEEIQQDRRSPFGDNPIFSPQFLPADQQTLDSPNGTTTAFIRDHNIWLRDLTTGDERVLTEDGTVDYSYSSNRCLGIDTAVQAQWSPDSKRLFTVRRDSRKVVPRTTINYVPLDGSLRPQVQEYKLPSPGDEHVDPYHFAAIEVSTGQLQAADYPPIPLTRSGILTDGFFRAKLGWWSYDSQHAFFVDVTRGAKAVRVVKWDTHSGSTQVLFEETSDTFVKLCHELLDPLQILPLPNSDELIWFSERSGWAHLYLYDLKTGKLKHSITEGEWLVRDLLHYDPNRRELLLRTAARDPDISPYYNDICKVNIDSGVLTTLVSGCFDHSVYLINGCRIQCDNISGNEYGEVNGVSPCGNYLVTTRSRVDTVPETLLIDRNGEEILTIEIADVSGLPTDWQWPEPVKLKGADGKTDIYGVVFFPHGFSPDKSYPVVEYANAARTFSGSPQGSFINSQQNGFVYYFASALAALGFIVVTMDGRGTPLRNKAFADHHYGDPAFTSDFTDRIAGLQQLAKRYPSMDLERVGIASAEVPTNAIYALLKYSDFYKVVVQHCPWDPRFVPAPFEEMYNGTVDKTVMTKACYPEDFVESFSGKLLLIVGMTSTITMASTFRFVEAMQKANKDFDMLCMPNMNHEMTDYTIRREWDYLVRNLQGIEPPQGFQFRRGDVVETDHLIELVDYA